jgi:hypothetical protein
LTEYGDIVNRHGKMACKHVLINLNKMDIPLCKGLDEEGAMLRDLKIKRKYIAHCLTCDGRLIVKKL